MTTYVKPAASKKTSHYIRPVALRIRLCNAFTSAFLRPRLRRAALRRLEIYAGRDAHRLPDAE